MAALPRHLQALPVEPLPQQDAPETVAAEWDALETVAAEWVASDMVADRNQGRPSVVAASQRLAEVPLAVAWPAAARAPLASVLPPEAPGVSFSVVKLRQPRDYPSTVQIVAHHHGCLNELQR